MSTANFVPQYNSLHAAGMAAKDAANHELAQTSFDQAAMLAAENGDGLRQLQALNPAARASWSMRAYDEATTTLETASNIADELNLADERGIIVSNMGRIAAVKIIDLVPVSQQRAALRADAVPRFREAQDILRGHPHLYYTYANAIHGSLVSALAGERKVTASLIWDGLRVAFRKSEQPYDQVPTYQVYKDAPKQRLLQLAAAAALIPFADRTPKIADAIRRRIR